MMADGRISDEAIRSVLGAEDFLASCDEAFRLYGAGEMTCPPRTESVERDAGAERFRLVMEAEWAGCFRGRKVIEERSDVGTGRLGHRSAWIEVEDLATGASTTLEAETITNGRTGAAGALGARYLGEDKPGVVALVGTGRIAEWLAVCADRSLKPERIRVTSRDPERRGAFVERLLAAVTCGVEAAATIEEAVREADVVLTAVPTPSPVLHEGAVRDGASISVIGGDPRTAQISPGLLKARPLVVDHPEQALASGDLRRAAERGDLSEVRFARIAGRQATIGDAALGRLAALRGRGAIAYLTGVAVQDLHAAVVALRRLGLTSH